jgi:hypothetical protein
MSNQRALLSPKSLRFRYIILEESFTFYNVKSEPLLNAGVTTREKAKNFAEKADYFRSTCGRSNREVLTGGVAYSYNWQMVCNFQLHFAQAAPEDSEGMNTSPSRCPFVRVPVLKT